jgi:hypothetical protein
MKYIIENGVLVALGTPAVEAALNASGATILTATDTQVVALLAQADAQAAQNAKPVQVTMRQARLVLLQAGLLDDVESAIAGMTGAQGQAAVIEWGYSNTLRRSQPLVAQLGAVLGLNTAQLDDLFLAASTI